MMSTNINMKCRNVAFALVVCASLVASLPTTSDPDAVVPEAALSQHSSACEGQESNVASIMEAAMKARTHPNWANAGLPQECVTCLESDNNNGCGMQPPGGGGDEGPSGECMECIMGCPYVNDNGCSSEAEEKAACSKDLIMQNCMGDCQSKCSDPEGDIGGDEGNDAGVCDHVDPKTEFGNEKCCTKNDRHDQNTCILRHVGPCDNRDPEEEPCCKESSHTAQAACYCAKTGPDENPCCGLSTHEGQAACGAVMAMQGDSSCTSGEMPDGKFGLCQGDSDCTHDNNICKEGTCDTDTKMCSVSSTTPAFMSF